MSNTLQERMAAHTPGQVSWPDLSQKRWCMHCAHFKRKNVKRKDDPQQEFGQCVQFKVWQKKWGVQFKGADAIACMLYEEGRK